ncbi:unnamed protein product [Prorocentrum cordatum]|uniref:Uncharacterized protein n=1 Tax=Prorocentrum cordatum TaxID=2364126 RepID=A0ABN9RID7_9DINO|nr:unnamed protein product [Polarella glacialis]
MLSLFREDRDMQRIDTLRSLGRDPRTAGSARASSRSLPEAGALHDPAEGPTPQSQGQAGRRGQGATGSGGAAGAPRGQVSRGQAADPLPRLLQGLRAKLLSAFGGLGKAYQLFAHAEGVLTRPSFERLCEVVGFGREAAGAMFPFIVALRSGSAGREVAGEPHISSVDFVRALRWSRPVAELSSLRQRLKVRFGGLREAFAEGTGGEKEMTWPQFRALVERTCVDPTSAQSLFWQILRHGRYTRLACREPTATRADFLRALRHAEGLSAAARLRARLREARARCGRPPPEHLEALPADAGDRAEQSNGGCGKTWRRSRCFLGSCGPGPCSGRTGAAGRARAPTAAGGGRQRALPRGRERRPPRRAVRVGRRGVRPRRLAGTEAAGEAS